MSDPEHKPLYMSVEEYLLFDEQSNERHEFVDGQVLAMSGASLRHNKIVNNLYRILDEHLGLDGLCRVFSMEAKVHVEVANSYYLPDIVVTCTSSNPEKSFVKSPILIAEVLSPTTAATDTREKRVAYGRLPSMHEYLLVHQSIQRVEIFRKTGLEHFFAPEEFNSGTFTLASMQGVLSINIEDIYRGCDWGGFPSPTPQVQEAAGGYSW